MSDICSEDRELGTQINLNDDNKVVKTLGIYWNNTSDMFKYKVASLPKENQSYTKRQILSESAKLFDPIGWVQPIIIVAKILLQNLWEMKLDWDESLDQEIVEQWIKYKNDMESVTRIEIPRCLGLGNENTKYEVHVFADASEKAYGAVAYLRNINEQTVNIIMAKSRVAPLKKITLARLELCAALLATETIKKLQNILELEKIEIFCWSDSTITLAWLNKNPNSWKTFVGNRVAQIQEVVPRKNWHHVKSADNPADLISRGCNATTLIDSTLWWHGPDWLSTWSSTEAEIFETQEEQIMKIAQVHNVIMLEPKFTSTNKAGNVYNLLYKFSSLNKLIRVFALILKAAERFKSQYLDKSDSELNVSIKRNVNALALIIKLTQEECFGSEIDDIQNNKLKNSSNLKKLDVWIDENRIIRIGGRLKHADMGFEQKHPIVLPYKHHITSLLIQDAHNQCLHAGNRLTLAAIRQKYWIIKGSSAVKFELRNCVICKRYRAQVNTQLMGQLPSARVTPHRPFLHTGCDLAGPIQIKSTKGRGIRTTKGYIVIFVCMSTKAMHIELVSDMSTNAFLAALRRLMARRGIVSEMYSDNGKNFVGANNVLIRENMKVDEDVKKFAKTENIKWHFLPPYSPHMGGLWEAGVKSVKYHLNRTLNGEKLTIEEMNTVLCQIESCLNSRPLVPMSEDIEDLDIITPGHFLIGSLKAPAEPSVLEVNPNYLNRWQQCSRLVQTFWKKWNTDYLNELRQRTKWTKTRPSLLVGDIVTLKEDNLPPNQWRMGKVVELLSGSDGLTRAV